MRPIALFVTTARGEFSADLKEPTRQEIVDAIETLYTEHDEEILSLRVEMPYEEGTFRYQVEDPDLTAEENASWIVDAIENFRY